MKRRLLSLLLTVLSCTAQEKPIILWDLHSVLFHQKNAIPLLLKYPYLSQMISHMSWPFIKDLLQSGVTTIAYLPIATVYDNPYLQNFIVQATNNVSLISDTAEIVKEVAALGYEQQIASNINPASFAQLTDPTVYPAYAPLFALFNLPASQTGYVDNGRVIKKPNPLYFAHYLVKNNISPTERPIIFIDDIKENVTVARTFGFDAILFKHPYQLRHELRKRGIAVHPPPYIFSNQRTSHSLGR